MQLFMHHSEDHGYKSNSDNKNTDGKEPRRYSYFKPAWPLCITDQVMKQKIYKNRIPGLIRKARDNINSMFLVLHENPLYKKFIKKPYNTVYNWQKDHNDIILAVPVFILKKLRRLYRFKPVRICIRLVVLFYGISIISALLLPKPLFTVPYSTVILSREGKLLAAAIADDQQWRFAYNKNIPLKYKTALLTFEDSRFYYHPGIDPFAVIRAFYLNIKHGKIKSGGSTISMQTIRIALGNRDRTVVQKLIEMFYCLGLELTCSKDEILGLYTTHAPFGGNIIGLHSASWCYFGRSAQHLSWAESALLAVLPNSPTIIHPGKNRSLLKQKRDRLLKKLNREGHINRLDYQLATDEPLPGEPSPLARLTPHLLNTLSGKHRLKGQLLKTTVRYDIQQQLNTIIDRKYQRFKQQGIHNICALIIDNNTAEVVAYTGNTMATPLKLSRSIIDLRGRDIDIIQKPRSTGSILKPYLYAAMLQAGDITPYTLIPDIPTQYNGYIPDNYDRTYKGAVPARTALAQSLNIPAVRMLKAHGLYRFYDYLKKLGLTTLHRHADDYGLTLILGGAEATLWDITRIYSMYAQTAVSGSSRSVRILKQSKQTVTTKPGISQGTAYMTMKAMLEVTRPGDERYWKNFTSSQKIAWKTGTSLGHRDAWSIGCTPKYTVGVWAGNADGEGKPELTGLSTAAPVLFEIFNVLPRSTWFKMPADQLKTIEICENSGYLATRLCRSKTILVPKECNFTKSCPYHQIVHLDRSGQWQVNSMCEPTGNMVHTTRFILPPVMEYFYIKKHSEYKKLPPLRKDCSNAVAARSNSPMNLIYPTKGTRLYIPITLTNKKSEAIFKAAHRDPQATIYWHLDDNYLTTTKAFHEIHVQPESGKHILVLVDNNGNRLERHFEIIGSTGRDPR